MKIYLNEKEITKEEAYELIGKRHVDRMIEDAEKYHALDPLEEQSWYMGVGMIEIKF